MPDGKVHGLTSLSGTVASAAFAYVADSPEVGIGLAAGFLFTLAVNPDLDLNRKISWRSPGEALFYVFWWPYSKLIPHRSIFSHFPLLGTAFRLIYLLPVVLAIRSIIHVSVPEPVVAGFLTGVVASDTLHAVMDVLSTRLKNVLFVSKRKR